MLDRCREATDVRRAWLRNLLARKTPPKGTAGFVASMIARHPDLLMSYGGNHLAAELLGEAPTVAAERGVRMARASKLTCETGYGSVAWMSEQDEPIVLPSAHRHGVDEEDMLHALRHAVRWFALDDEMTMSIGPSTTGTVLEIGTIAWYGDQIAIAHAMPAREKFLR